MTSIFLLDSDPRFRSLLPQQDETILDLAERFDGTPIGERWVPLRIEYDSDSLSRPVGDFPGFPLQHIPVFTVHAAEALGSVLESNGELLSLKTDDSEFFAFNVTSVVSALSSQSKVVYYPSGGIMDVTEYVLDSSRLTSAAIFKLPETALMDVFVNDEFVALIERTKLQGFSFRSVAIE